MVGMTTFFELSCILSRSSLPPVWAIAVPIISWDDRSVPAASQTPAEACRIFSSRFVLTHGGRQSNAHRRHSVAGRSIFRLCAEATRTDQSGLGQASAELPHERSPSHLRTSVEAGTSGNNMPNRSDGKSRDREIFRCFHSTGEARC